MAQIQYEALAGRPASAINGALAGTLMSAILLTLLTITSFMILVRCEGLVRTDVVLCVLCVHMCGNLVG